MAGRRMGLGIHPNQQHTEAGEAVRTMEDYKIIELSCGRYAIVWGRSHDNYRYLNRYFAYNGKKEWSERLTSDNYFFTEQEARLLWRELEKSNSGCPGFIREIEI